MKRSKHIRLFLIGGISVGALAGCGPDGKPPISAENVYANDYFVPGVGYYHAPFRAWYALPFNHFDQEKQQYYFGGHWAALPCESITNVSSPMPQAASQAEAMRTDVTRGGFGGTYVGGSSFFS